MFSLLSHLIAAYFCFLLPVYRTFKSLSKKDVSEPELERWSMYWAVIGTTVAFEYLCEFVISWVPFYWELKTLFLLFLALPQTQGSTYIYKAYLQPFFATHEADIDAGILSIQAKIFSIAQARLAGLWQMIMGALNKQNAAGQSAQSAPGPAGSPAAGPGMTVDSALGLLRTFGPSLMSALQPPASAPGTPPVAPPAAPTASTTSFQAPAAEHRTPAAEAPPPFPEPQHAY